MSKKISLLFCLMFSLSALGMDKLCSPMHWRDTDFHDLVLDKFALFEDFLDASREDDFSVYMNDKDHICIKEDIDVAKVQAICFETGSKIPYCDFQKNTLLHLSAQFSDDTRVIDGLIKMGVDIQALNSLGKSVKDFADYNDRHPEIVDHVWVDPADEYLANAVVSTAPQLAKPDWELDYEIPTLESPDEVEERLTVPVESEEPAPPPRPARRRRFASQVGDLNYDIPGQRREGLYVSLGVGVLTKSTIHMESEDNDVPGSCVDASITNQTPFYNCFMGQNRWSNAFPSSGGRAISGAVGYKLGSVSVEAEWSSREQNGSTSDIEFHTTRSLEFQTAEESLTNMQINTRFANVYMDFENISPSFIPFVGIGGGMIEQRYDYGARLIRIPNKDVLEFFDRGPESAQTATQDQEVYVHNDTTAQFMAGFKIPVANGKSELFLKARYILLPEITAASEWDVLRSAEGSYSPVLRQKVKYTHEIKSRGSFDIMAGFNIFFRR